MLLEGNFLPVNVIGVEKQSAESISGIIIDESIYVDEELNELWIVRNLEHLVHPHHHAKTNDVIYYACGPSNDLLSVLYVLSLDDGVCDGH
jgi:hypothetical protein